MAQHFELLNKEYYENPANMIKLGNDKYTANLFLFQLPFLGTKYIHTSVSMEPKDQQVELPMAYVEVYDTRLILPMPDYTIGIGKRDGIMLTYKEKFAFADIQKSALNGTLTEPYRICYENLLELDRTIREMFPGFGIIRAENEMYDPAAASRVEAAYNIADRMQNELYCQLIELKRIKEISAEGNFDRYYLPWCGESEEQQSYRAKITEKTGNPDFWKRYNEALTIKEQFDRYCNGEDIIHKPELLHMN